MNQNKLKIESISIGLASPVRIRKQAERTLPNGKKIGQITTSKTVDYKTFKPEPEGLFCEKIFGPINDFECSCGTKNLQIKHKFCPNCDVEITTSRVRRYRIGYIKLIAPVAHIWYLKGRPSFLSLLLNMKRKRVESLIYGSRVIYIPLHNLTKTVSTKTITFCKNPTKISSINQYYDTKYIHNFYRDGMFKTQVDTSFCNFDYTSLFFRKKNKQTNQPAATKKKLFLNKKIKYSKKEINVVSKKIKNKSKPHSIYSTLDKFTNFLHFSNYRIQKSNTVNRNNTGKNVMSKKNLPQSRRKLNLQNPDFQVFPGFVKKKRKNWEKEKNTYTSNFFFQNKPNLNKVHFWKNNSTLKKKNKSTNSSNVTEINDKNFSFNAKSIFTMYYPFSSKCKWKDTWEREERTKEAVDKWKGCVTYTTSNSTRYDIGIPFYMTRISNQPFVVNNENYKYISTFLGGTEGIWYLLRNIHVPFLKASFIFQLPKLDISIGKFERARFLYKFEKRKLRKLRKIRLQIRRRLKLVRYCQKLRFRPEWLIVSILPVLPPDLRPIIRLDGNQTAVSDLNQLYKRVLDRNKRIEKMLKTSSLYSSYIRFNQRLLQEAVDSLIDNGKGGARLASAPNGRPFKSLSEILKGKKGRFRLNLLGKRVDYSGRSVIVVGPKLKLHQCGLPKEMAVELFQPFLIRELRKNNIETTIINSKRLIHEHDPIIWKILKKMLRTHPILLNRAPTLHRLGIQAFQAKLVEGRAILLHPLVCTAFNADFDGDQMAVHIPLSFQARAEAWKLMWSRNNILSPATGDPIIVPSQDMVLGCYYLTTNTHNHVSSLTSYDLQYLTKVSNEKSQFKQPSINLIKPDNQYQKNSKLLYLNSTKSNFLHLQVSNYFSSLDEVLTAFKQKKILIHSLIWVKWVDFVQVEDFYEKPLEVRIDWYGNTIQVYSKYWRSIDKQSNQISQFICTTPGRVLLNKTILHI